MAFGFFKKKKEADTVFKNAVLVAPSPEDAHSDAVAVLDGKILSIGCFSDMSDIVGPDTRIVDLGGRYLCAGLTDAFAHPADGMFDGLIDLTGMDSEKKVMFAIKDSIDAHPDMEYCLAYGLRMDLLADRNDPDENPLDMLSDRIPLVAVREDGLSMSVNTLALEIVKACAEEMGVEVITPEFVMDTLISVDYEKNGINYYRTIEKYLKKGYTSIYGDSCNTYLEGLFRSLSADLYGFGLAKIRYFGSLCIRRSLSPSSIIFTMDKYHTLCTELDNYVNFNSLHLFISSDRSDYSYMDSRTLNEVCENAADKGYCVRITCKDKEALRNACEALGNVAGEYTQQSFGADYDFDVSPEEFADIYMDGLIDLTQRSSDIDYLCEESAKIIGADTMLGYLLEGFNADFAIFAEDPAVTRNQDAYMTVVGGEIVYEQGNLTRINDWQARFMDELSQYEDSEEQERS